MTATLCELIGSASLSLRSRTMLMVAVCGCLFCCGAVAIIDLPLSVFLAAFLALIQLVTAIGTFGKRACRRARLHLGLRP